MRGHDGQRREVKRRYRLTGRVSPTWGTDPALCLAEMACKAILENPLSILVADVRGGLGVTAVTIFDTGTCIFLVEVYENDRLG